MKRVYRGAIVEMKKDNRIVGSLCALGCETLYGLSYMFTKQATESASELALLGWRFLIAAVAMSILVFSGAIKVNLKGKDIKPLLMVALFSPCIYYIGETIGISYTTSSESGVFLACIPVASLIASTLILKKKPTPYQIAGILITLAGVVMTVLAVGASSSLSGIGYAFLFLAVASYALYGVFVDKANDFTGLEITYVMLLAGAVLFIVLALAEAAASGNARALMMLPFEKGTFLIAIVYQGIGCSVIAFFLSNIAIAKIGVNKTSSFIGVSTVVSIISGALVLGETFTVYQIFGAVVIIIGVYIANAKIRGYEPI
ncbi:MAG: DMT family transporter [Firmicutes bacterium]|nr:DMT family transporter [Bacillota bacterium]